MLTDFDPQEFSEAMNAAERARLKLRNRGEALSWYVVVVAPQKEIAAQTILRKVGVQCFVPIEKKFPRKRNRHLNSGKKLEPKEYPMFTSYLFAGFAGPTWLYELARFPIVRGVVGFEGHPFRLPPAVVDRLIENSGQSIPWRAAPNPHRSFQEGDTAFITEGMFTGHKVEIVAISGKFAEFMGEFFGKRQRLKVPLDFMEAA